MEKKSKNSFRKPLKISAACFVAELAVYLIMRIIDTRIAEQHIYFRSWLAMINDACTLLVLPLTLVVLSASMLFYFGVKTQNHAGRSVLKIIRLLVVASGILYGVAGGFYFLLFSQSGYESENIMEDGKTIEGRIHPFLGGRDDDTFAYYSKEGIFLKKWIRYSESKLDLGQVKGTDSIYSDEKDKADYDRNDDVDYGGEDNRDTTSLKENLQESAEVEESEKSGHPTESDSPEEWGEILYQKIFASQGFSYDARYNAKGNYYILLEEYDTEISGQKAHCRHTVVYNRISENGKCQLFVEYREYDDPNTGT